MAVASGSKPLNFGNLGCGFASSTGTQYTYIDSVSSNGLQSNGKIEYVVKVSGSVSINNLVWSSASGSQSWSFSCGGSSQSASTNKQCQSTGNCAGGGCCCCICSGTTYNPGQKTFTIQLSPSVTTITASVSWNGNSAVSATYNIPASMRITKPNGFSVSWPSSVTGGAYCSVSDWGGASSGSFSMQLLSSSGSVLDTESSSTYNTYKYLYTGGSVTANSRYRLRSRACNSVDCTSYTYSSYYYTAPPTPSVYINSLLYDPSSQKCVCNWSWSKPTDAGYYNETITYDVYDNEGNYYARGVSLGSATGGTAKSGTITTTGILTAVNLCVKVYVSTSAGTSNQTACAYAPVAGAAFLGFDWDELRRTCTVRATAPGARQTRVSGGYAPNVYNIGTKLTEGEFGDLVVKDLDHGAGEILYLEAMPEAKDNHQYLDEVAKISIPIPNPILGVHTPSCEQIAAGKEKEYIVDIIEKKKGVGACTPRWQNGDRVVKKDECPPPVDSCPFLDIEIIDDTGAPIPSPNIISAPQTFPPLTDAPTPHCRIYRFTFAPGWNKEWFFGDIIYNDSTYPVTLEWVNDTDLKVTYEPHGSFPAIASFEFGTNIAGGRMTIWTQVTASGRKRKYRDDWTYSNDSDTQCRKRFAAS